MMSHPRPYRPGRKAQTAPKLKINQDADKKTNQQPPY